MFHDSFDSPYPWFTNSSSVICYKLRIPPTSTSCSPSTKGNDSALLQSSQAPEFAGKKSDATNGIIEILEVAESDFSRLAAENEAGESEVSETLSQTAVAA